MQKAQNQSQQGYNRPQLLEEILESYTGFEKMRVEHPVIYSEEMRMWQVFRYEDVSQAITNHADFSSTIMGASGVSVLKDTLIATDPPDHRKLRNLVNLAFTPKSVARLSGRITEITQELLDEVLPRGEMDIVPEIAFPLPAKVIAEMI